MKRLTTRKRSTSVLIALTMIMALCAASCAHKTCPAYRGSVSEVVVNQ